MQIALSVYTCMQCSHTFFIEINAACFGVARRSDSNQFAAVHGARILLLLLLFPLSVQKRLGAFYAACAHSYAARIFV
jgi:hypothetical protein